MSPEVPLLFLPPLSCPSFSSVFLSASLLPHFSTALSLSFTFLPPSPYPIPSLLFPFIYISPLYPFFLSFTILHTHTQLEVIDNLQLNNLDSLGVAVVTELLEDLVNISSGNESVCPYIVMYGEWDRRTCPY